MSLEVIYVTRHGFRSNWVVDEKTGEYSSSIPSPTGIPSDPALAGYGVTQSHELATHLINLSPPIQRFYSSPFYRCIQTISPAVSLLSSKTSSPEPQTTLIRGENGIGEWYGMARFDHPSPANPQLLRSLFENYDEGYGPVIKPSVNGEKIEELHDRAAYAMHRIIEQSDNEGVKAICVCTHAATLIAIGRVLTGRMPNDVGEEDFRPFTCGVSTFVRRKGESTVRQVDQWKGPETEIPQTGWRDGSGVGRGWDCTLSGDCSFLSGGEERGWKFSGDESFISKPGEAPALDAGSGLGTVVEGKKNTAGPLSPSRL
ncbi:Transcription factor C subunit 7 [Hyphodiscus hymeniophilus]|uniref:Transcription factor C subunit 7 n=1 Tax=Hyphodiscus hymeniophilus TaxID=353542 RepID=A0A9P6VRA2_9HELO|nr:Transcription factor C subunit 7 [Hyphodiscus hymeniophilus]